MPKYFSNIVAIVFLAVLFWAPSISNAQVVRQGEKTKKIIDKAKEIKNTVENIDNINDIVDLFNKKKEKEEPTKLPLRSLNDLIDNAGGVEFSPLIFTPLNIQKDITYNHQLNSYKLTERFEEGSALRIPQILSFSDFQKRQTEAMKKAYWKEISKVVVGEARLGRLDDYLKIDIDAFKKMFGGGLITTDIKGYFGATVGAKLNVNESPYLSEAQRSQWIPELDSQFQINADVKIGDKLSFDLNLANKIQFDFEKLNQIKLQYKGDEDQIIQYLEWGNVSFPLNTNLIRGAQTLRGVRSVLKFGPLQIQSTLSQQESQNKRFTFSQSSLSQEIDIEAIDYDENRHFFLAQYFRDNFNRHLADLPIIRTNIEITRVEVWVTNRKNENSGSRDIVALMDLGEYTPYNNLFTGGGSYLPSGFNNSNYPTPSNDILDRIPISSRDTNDNSILSFFAGTGGTDNFAKIAHARRLNENEFTYHPKLGFISLNLSLSDDDVLAVAYRYNVNGVEYQVGEFSTDRPYDPINPEVLYTKLLKNQSIKTNLPIWDLMMKNIYKLDTRNLDEESINLDLVRLDENTGSYLSYINEGSRKGETWLRLTEVDNRNSSQEALPDGQFDYFEGITIVPERGLIMFPILEPFGSDLEERLEGTNPEILQRYIFNELYEEPKSEVERDYPHLNRYFIKGFYSSKSSSDFQLNAFNIPRGSVVVSVGSNRLVEGIDYTVDYAAGRIKIINEGYLNSGLPVEVTLESNDLFGIVRKNFLGLRLDYKVNRNLNIGTTFLNLHEISTVRKVNIGDEAINNSIWGFDVQYNKESRLLTKFVNLLPFYKTEAISNIELDVEYAKFMPGHDKRHNINGTKGTSYIDAFESAQQVHSSLNSRFLWRLAGTPQRFSENLLSNNLDYSKQRAHITWYHVDDLYNVDGTNRPPDSFPIEEQANHYQRRVRQNEIYPNRDLALNSPLYLQVLNLDYYPQKRGAYNYSLENVNREGQFIDPKNRWGGIMRKIDGNDFEAYNVQYIEFWLMDPFLYDQSHEGGDLYLNLGQISEDILKDGLKSVENALPTDGDENKVDNSTVWGRVAKLAPLIDAFDNNPDNRTGQDIGLDGLSNSEERTKFEEFLDNARITLDTDAYGTLFSDPSSDDFSHYSERKFQNINANAHQRFEFFANMEGNSRTAQQSSEQLGIPIAAASNNPDSEDINNDNTLSLQDEYFEYRVSIRPNDLEIGKNHIVDKREVDVELADGSSDRAVWYLFRIPINAYENVFGNISDFRSIRFIRTYLHDFSEKVTLRFGTLRLVKGDWNIYNPTNSQDRLLVADEAENYDPINCTPSSNTVIVPDNSNVEIGVVNIEENAGRSPIPYTIPPGIEREINYNTLYGNTQKNEQSLSFKVNNLGDGYIRAVYKNVLQDLRRYANLEMFVHAEGENLNDDDVSAVVRIGSDFIQNYYEIEIPLKATPYGSASPESIWPSKNNVKINLNLLKSLKIQRDQIGHSPIDPYTMASDEQKITVKGYPDLGKVKIILLGVKNSLRCVNTVVDDGLEKTAEVWFNELRVTGYDEQGGWGAVMSMRTQLADFANIALSGSYNTEDFGSLDQGLTDTEGNLEKKLDLQASLDLGLLFPKKFGLSIPSFIAWNYQYSLPKYDPSNPDTEWSQLRNYYDADQVNEFQHISEDVTIRRNFNFTNIRKKRTGKSRVDFWDIENVSLSFSYSELDHRNYLIESQREFNYNGNIQYNYTPKKKLIYPFKKLIGGKKAKYLAFIRDFNFSPLPSSITARLNFNRKYYENLKRNNTGVENISILPNFKKNFNIDQNINVAWDFSKSFRVNFNANNKSIVDEPYGRLEGAKRDTFLNNLKKLGRTVQYKHALSANYKLPFSKFYGLEWLNTSIGYNTSYQWDTESLQTLRDPRVQMGNTIMNSQKITLNSTIQIKRLTDKFPFIKRWEQEKKPWRFLIAPLTSIRTFNINYNREQSTFLPGFLPKSKLFGQDQKFTAPGLGFIFGSQKDIRQTASENGWLTKYEYQNKLYLQKLTHNLKANVVLSPIKNLRIQLNMDFSYGEDYSSKYKYERDKQRFVNLSEQTTGNYKVSTILLGTAFQSNGEINPEYIKNFLDNRTVISQRLGELNPHSSGLTTRGYADGYSSNSQDVVIPALIAALKKQNASSIPLDAFGFIPLPNWRLSYRGKFEKGFLADIFRSFDINHQYSSSYSVGNFITDNRYLEYLGYSFERNNNNDFLPRFLIDKQFKIEERFSPLIGINIRFQNDISLGFDYIKSRELSLGITTGQINETNNSGISFNVSYRTTELPMFRFLERRLNLNNDVQIRLDFSIKDSKTVIYRFDVEDTQITAGAKIINFQPSLDFSLSEAITARIFAKGDINNPYTSKSFRTAYYEFGISFRYSFTNDFSLRDLIKRKQP